MAQLIGVSGKICSGKDYFSDKITEELEGRGFTVGRTSFGKALKHEITDVVRFFRAGFGSDAVAGLMRISNTDAKQLSVYLQNDSINDPDLDGFSRTVNMRSALQYHGTDIRRTQYPNYWTDRVLAETWNTDKDYLIVTDCRFPNEADMIHGSGGYVFRMDVPEEVLAERRAARDSVTYTEAQLASISETALDEYESFYEKVGVQFDTEQIINRLRSIDMVRELRGL